MAKLKNTAPSATDGIRVPTAIWQAETATERIAAGLSGHPLAIIPTEPSATQEPPITDLLLCSPPKSRNGPAFELTLRRPILFEPPPLITPDKLSQQRLAGTSIAKRDKQPKRRNGARAYCLLRPRRNFCANVEFNQADCRRLGLHDVARACRESNFRVSKLPAKSS
jgi:hypothetical protein